MSGVRLELANLDEYFTPKQYVQEHLAPVATELHRLCNEFFTPGSTSEATEADFTPELLASEWMRLDTPLHNEGKRVVFDGAEYFNVSKELLRAKQAKVQLTAVLYAIPQCEEPRPVEFRLVREDGMVIEQSKMVVNSIVPVTETRILSFGDAPGLIVPAKHTYFLEAISPKRASLPVCRRFSLSFVYI